VAGQHPQQPESQARQSPAWEDLVLVGRIARPHGIRGQVAINPETDFVEERFAAGATVWMQSATGPEPLTIASMRVHNGRPIVAFEGSQRIEDVEPLAGRELRVPEETLHTLEPGTFYQHQLVGCEVETVAGKKVGVVSRVGGGAAGSLLTVDGEQGEVLVPMVADICVEIDVVARRIRIDPPDGLLELNART
jgi:16S rRNA processing protein RimM